MNQRTKDVPSVDTLVRADGDAFRLLVDSTRDYAIFMLDPQGRVASWNEGARRIKGYEAHDIIGRHFSTFYPAEANANGWPAHELSEATRVGRFEDEGWRVRKDGTQFWANVVITALRDAGGVLRGFGKVTRDLTERKAQEEYIKKLSVDLEHRVQELAQTNRELAQQSSENQSFVYSVSHDLRSPLVNLQGFSHELTLTARELERVLDDPRVPDDVRTRTLALLKGDFAESLGFIDNAVRHSSNIIDGLLRLSRAGRVEYEPKPMNASVVVRDIVSAMHGSIVASGGTVEVRPLPEIVADEKAVGQIFANILGNALKSFQADRPGRIVVSADDQDPPVFSIQDNGIGIPQEYQPKIFQVFQHVHQRRDAGEGLGLAIVRRIVERHGGQIWFESAAGVGTTFFFTVGPRVQVTGAAPDRG